MHSYVFPLLDVKEISLCLQSCGFTASDDLITRPTSQYMQTLFEQIADSFLGISVTTLSKNIKKINPDLEDLNEAKDIISLQRVIYRFLCDCGVDNFSLMDMMKPEPGRVRVILSSVVNFARFREEHMADCEKFLIQNEEKSELYKTRTLAVKSLKNQVNHVEDLLSKDENDLNQIKSHNKEVEGELRKMRKKQETLTLEYENYKDGKTRLVKQLEDHSFLLLEAKKDLEKLKFYSNETPEINVKINQDLASSLETDEKKLHLLEQKSRNLSLTIESFSILEQEFKSFVRLLEEIQIEINKHETSNDKFGKFKELYEQQQLQSSDLNRKIQQITRQINNTEEKIDRTKQQSEKKRLDYQEKLKELHDNYATLITERDINDQDLFKKKQHISNLEKQMFAMKKQFEVECRETNLEIERLNSHIKRYLLEMEKKMGL